MSYRLLSGNGRAYVVQPGDSLWKIGQRLNTCWRRLAKINNIKDPFIILPGQMIVLPES